MLNEAITLSVKDLNENYKQVLEIKVDLSISKCVTVDDEAGFVDLYLSKVTALALAEFIFKTFKKEEDH